MKALISISTALAVLLFAATSALAQSSSPVDEQYGGSSDDVIVGVVSEVGEDGTSVLISDGNSLYDMTITPSTRFVDGVVYIPEDTPPRGPTAADLKPGLEVEVQHTGVLAESYPAQGEAERITFLSPWYEEGTNLEERSFVGYLTSVAEDEVRVQQNPDATINDPGYCEQTLDFTLTGETVISDALAVGERVEVVYLFDPDGFYTQQCPGKFPAQSVTVLGADNGDDGGNNDDGGNGGGSDDGTGGTGGTGQGSDGTAVASDEYAVLPDTGGPSAVGIVLTVAAVTILAGIYRTMSRS